MEDFKQVMNELIHNDEFMKKFQDIGMNEKDPNKQKTLMIQLINEYGHNYNESDFEFYPAKTNGELSEEELAAVNGGGTDCICVLGGGSSGSGWTCACVVGGAGEDPDGHSCMCCVGGSGTNLKD